MIKEPPADSHIRSLFPSFQIRASRLLDRARKAGIRFTVLETKRSEKRQYYFYGRGRTYSQCIRIGMSQDEAEMYSNPHVPQQVSRGLDDNFVLGKAMTIRLINETDKTFIVEEAAIQRMKVSFLHKYIRKPMFCIVLEDLDG